MGESGDGEVGSSGVSNVLVGVISVGNENRDVKGVAWSRSETIMEEMERN